MKHWTLTDVKRFAIKSLDWLDDCILHHRLYSRGLCAWIACHPWWGE